MVLYLLIGLAAPLLTAFYLDFLSFLLAACQPCYRRQVVVKLLIFNVMSVVALLSSFTVDFTR